MNMSARARDLGLALAMGVFASSTWASVPDAGTLDVYPNAGSYYYNGTNSLASGMIWDVVSVANGVTWRPDLYAEGNAFSGYSDYSSYIIKLDAYLVPDANHHITSYTVTVSGTVSAYGTGRASLSVDANDPHDVISTSWTDLGNGAKSFSWSHTFATADWHPVLNLNAFAGASYVQDCVGGYLGSCTYQQGVASLLLSSVQLRANLAANTPAVPEADLAWMALTGAALVAARGRRMRT